MPQPAPHPVPHPVPHLWEPEHVVDEARARLLLAACFPGFTPRTVEDFGCGWDNTVFLVDGEWVFRFPRRELAGQLIEAECAVLPAIAPRVPLPVPVPEWIGKCEEHLPWTFAGYRLLSGRTACRAAPDATQRAAAAPIFARFLAALHALPADEMRRRGATGDTLGRVDLGKRVPMTEARIEEAQGLGLLPRHGVWEAAIDDLPGEWIPEEATLVHGDLYARHLLLDDAQRPCGIIDWGDVHLGDPAVDLALARGFLPPAAQGAFRDAYGPIDEDRWRVARFRAVFSAVAILVYGHHIGDRDLVREGLLSLEHVAG